MFVLGAGYQGMFVLAAGYQGMFVLGAGYQGKVLLRFRVPEESSVPVKLTDPADQNRGSVVPVQYLSLPT